MCFLSNMSASANTSHRKSIDYMRDALPYKEGINKVIYHETGDV